MNKTTTLLFLFLILFSCITADAQKKGKDKDKGKNKKEPAVVDYQQADPEPDTSRRFTGIIKYRITSDDPSERDSMFVIFGEKQIGIVMFIPGYRADQVFEQHFIARFSDTTLLTLDPKNKTYKTEKLDERNAGTEFMLLNYRKTAPVMGFTCPEYKGSMTLKDGTSFEAACLVSNQHYFNSTIDYNFLNIQPMVLGYRIVLGYRNKSPDNENSYFMAYKIEPGNMESYFDLSQYKPK
ncbi:MAG TPA: hypothetical protein PK092_11135 [Chitinophagaceae bacterium]|nr:hypothetical protein [Chitinophagaceae bacterium]